MEVFALLKFWKSNSAKVAAGTTAGDDDGAETFADSVLSDPLTEDSDDDDDSFFELELSLPDYDSKFPTTEPCFKKSDHEREFDDQPKASSKPQSPTSILRSASPKLRVFMFGGVRRKSKQDDSETESVSSNLSPRRSNSNLFTVKFRIEDGSIVPKFTRSNSSSLFSSPKRNSDNSYQSSRRFFKDALQKYINLIKPPFGKSSKKSGETDKFPASPAKSTASAASPRKDREEKQSSRFKVKCRHLGKSKSASSIIVSRSPVSFPARNDHTHDGIEGAILHCKRSLNSSTGKSSLSRCSSDPSHEKSIQVSEQI